MFGFMRKPAPPPAAERTRPTLQEAFGPPLTDEELAGNLSVLQQKLERSMKCPAGKGQVYLRSLLTGKTTTKPRIALKCVMRKDIGLPKEVFFEHIRDVCCCNPDQCEAYQAFKKRGGH